jgi:hypothetical protein
VLGVAQQPLVVDEFGGVLSALARRRRIQDSRLDGPRDRPHPARTGFGPRHRRHHGASGVGRSFRASVDGSIPPPTGGVAIIANGEQGSVVSVDGSGLVTLIRDVVAPINPHEGPSRRLRGASTERPAADQRTERPPFDGRFPCAPTTGEATGPRTGGRLAPKRG